MDRKDVITMRIKEIKRIKVIENVKKKKIKQREAAEILGVTERQVRRIVKRFRKEGEKGLVHKLRGRESNRKMPEEKVENMADICGEKYKGFGPTLASEKLLELDKMRVSPEKLRNIMIDHGLWVPRRKSRKHRKWRERKKHCGEMVQMDGSHHNWLEGRGEELTLMGYIDDATNRVYAEFHEYEGTKPAMKSFKGYIRKYGIPQKVYLDKHTTYKSPKKETLEEQLTGKRPKSQFERALGELGVDVAHANSPQAKGRIERLFRTLQDRLIKEMRLDDISTKKEANKFLKNYLPKYNERFAVEAAGKEDLHRDIDKEIDLNKVFAIRTERTVRNDFTILHERQYYQLETGEVLRGRKVMVEERLDGWTRIDYKGRYIKYKKVKGPVMHRTKIGSVSKLKIKRKHKPVKKHPWKRPYKDMYDRSIAL